MAEDSSYGKRPLWQWIALYTVIGGLVYGLIYYGFLKKNGNSYMSQNYTQPQTAQQNAAPSAAAPGMQALTVDYTENGFMPDTITVQKGQTVTWVNKDSDPMWVASAVHPVHSQYDGTSLSEHCSNGTGTSFDACKGIGTGQTYTFTFDKSGTWKYHNHLNPANTGTVIVQ